MNRGTDAGFFGLRFYRKAVSWITVFVILFSLVNPQMSVQAAVALTLAPLSWNVVGLDSNNVNVGPNDFPVGARVCNTGDVKATNLSAAFVWDSSDAYIDLRPESAGTLSLPELLAGACANFYFEVLVARNSAAYNHTRRYHIEVTSTETPTAVSTPTPREIFVEHLVSQNRNSVQDIQWKPASQSGYTSVAANGSMTLLVGGTYDIKLVASTATQGYNQLEDFITLSNTFFRVNSVSSTYSATALYSAPGSYDKLYADSCGWDNNPLSATYRACVVNDNKSGGDITTNFNVTILSGGGSNLSLNSMVYDFSGSSYHYNSDYSTSARTVSVITPAVFSKAFSPSTIAAGETSTLTFTIKNISAYPVSGVSFKDSLPAIAGPSQMVVAPTPTPVITGCGPNQAGDPTPTLTAVNGASAISFSDGSIAAGATCTVSLKVTVPANGVYANTSDSLVINSVDTGVTATATLTAAATSTGTGLTCTDQPLVKWTFPTGFALTAPAAPTNTVSAAASIGAGLTANTGTTHTADATSAWGSNGNFDKTGSLTEPNLALNDYFEFSLDTTNLSALKLTFWVAGTQNGPENWAVYYGTAAATLSTKGTASTGWASSGTISFADNQLNTSGATLFRIYGYNAKQNNAGADMYLDDVLFSGCAQPSQPKLEKAFSSPTVAVDGLSTLKFTLTNANGVDLTDARFSDPLPSGLVIGAASVPGDNTCGGSFAVGIGDTSLALSGGTIPASGSCTIEVKVKSAAAGVYTNVSGRISTLEMGTNTTSSGTTSASLTVLAAPGFTKRFSPNPIYAGGTSTLTFQLTNPNSIDLTGATFSDSLVGGYKVAATPAASTTCADAIFAPAANATTLSFSGGKIPANSSCQVKVNVTAAATGNYDNSTTLSTDVSGLTSLAATDTLAVIAHYPGIRLSKQVASTASGPWTSFKVVAPGTPVYYRLTVENTGDVDLASVTVSDPTLDLTGCLLTEAFTLTTLSPTASCTVGSVNAAAGDVLNTASASGTYNNTVYSSISTADYLGVTISNSAAAMTLVKQVGRSTVGPWSTEIAGVSVGTPLYYRFTIINSGNTSLSELGITDPSLVTDSCEWLSPLESGKATSCVVGPVNALAGTHVNTASASASATSSPDSSATYTAGSYALSGKVWEDTDGDLAVDAGEPALFNVALNLYLDDGDGTFDAATDTFFGSQYSDINGAYSFGSLDNGTYFVKVVGGLTGYTLVSGGSNTNPRKVDLVEADSSGNNFGYQLPGVDLGVSKDNGAASVDAGGTTSYTIRVTNFGSLTMTAATLTDTVLDGLTLTGATCSSALGNKCVSAPLLASLSTGLSLPALAKNEFFELLVSANVTNTSGTVSNKATVAPPNGSTDVKSSNDTSTDTDLVNPVADLGVSKTDGVEAVNAGGSTVYTIRVTNSGPSAVTGASLTDPTVTGLAVSGIICSTASGNKCLSAPDAASLAGGVGLPALQKNEFYEIKVTATVSKTSGTIANQVTVAPPVGTTDKNATNDTSTDSDTITPVANLAITIDDSVTTVATGGPLSYIIVVTNAGPSGADGSIFTLALTAGLNVTGVSCGTETGSAVCPDVSVTTVANMEGTGIIIPTLPSGGSVTFTVNVTATASSGIVKKTAGVAVPTGSVDSDLTDNSADDSDSIVNSEGKYYLYLPIMGAGVQIDAWQVALGYEDMPLLSGRNDYDYNDWGVEVDGRTVYDWSESGAIRELDMTFVPRSRGAGYDHSFWVNLPANAFSSSGVVTLSTYDANHSLIATQIEPYTAGTAAKFRIFAQTRDALPGMIANTIESDQKVAPQLFVKMSILFDQPVQLTVDLTDAHGAGLFFDPTLQVEDTKDEVHQGDLRLLAVPSKTMWMWPEEYVRIDLAYPKVVFERANPPIIQFPDRWWETYNHCVYDGVAGNNCGVP